MQSKLIAVVSTSRRDDNAEQTRDALIESALQHFGSGGYSSASIEDIARTARVTKGALYHHFADKAAVFEAVFELQEQQLLDAVIKAVGRAKANDPWDEFQRGLTAYLLRCSDPTFRQIVLQDAPTVLGWTTLKAAEERHFLGLLRAILEQLSAEGFITAEPTDLTARMVLAALTEAGVALTRSRRVVKDRAAALEVINRMLR